MRLVGPVAALLLIASPAFAQPDPTEPGPPADASVMTEDVRSVLLQLQALERATAARAAEADQPPVDEQPLQRTSAGGSRLLREAGRGASNVRVSRGCPSLSCTRTY